MSVCVSGYFNPIEASHVEYFKRAKRTTGADKLVVLVKNDPGGKKARVLSEFKCVDSVISVTEDMDDTVCKTLENMEDPPDYYCIGRHFNQVELDLCDRLDIQVIKGLDVETETWLGVFFRKVWISVEYLLYNHI
jgi:glycerol-3-phosphate cytidylyltransferase-like family protein